jgi:hypothetical protein
MMNPLSESLQIPSGHLYDPGYPEAYAEDAPICFDDFSLPPERRVQDECLGYRRKASAVCGCSMGQLGNSFPLNYVSLWFFDFSCLHPIDFVM